MKKLKVENSQLVRDPHSKALLSTDLDGLRKYKEQKKRKDDEKAKLAEIDTIKKDLEEVKFLLNELLKRNSD